MSLDLTNWQTKKWTTRAGLPVRLLCVDRRTQNNNNLLPIIGLITTAPGREHLDCWTVEGSSNTSKAYDLRRAPTIRHLALYRHRNMSSPEVWVYAVEVFKETGYGSAWEYVRPIAVEEPDA